MRALADQADGLLRALRAATAALHDHLSMLTDATLADLEVQLDSLLREYGLLLREMEPTKSGSPVDKRYESFLRAMVTFATLIELIAPQLGEPTGRPWGSHVFADSHFRYIQFDKLPGQLPPDAVRLIFPDQCSDLKSAVETLERISLLKRPKAFIFAHLDQIALILGYDARSPHTLGINLMTAEWVRDQCGHSDTRPVKRMTRQRRIISVPTWTGERMYPEFQFERGKLLDSVQLVCREAHSSLTDWPLAVWMAMHKHQKVPYFEQRLGEIGLWMPSRLDGPSHQFQDLARAAATDAPFPLSGPLYRVSRSENSPFYFSSADAADPHAGGRFDLAGKSGHGSLYTGETPVGAWSEVFDRLPVLTLHDLFERRLWELRPQGPLEVWNLEHHRPQLFSTRRRADTQEVAAMAFNQRRQGLRVRLRSVGGEMGAVLFGRAGATLPSAAGIGLWNAEPTHGIEDHGLWQYITQREENNSAFPVVLRRFPTELKLLPGG